MKTKIFTFALIIFINISLSAQIPNWSWAKGASGMGAYGYSTISDEIGNVYVTGQFYTTINFGDTTLISTGFPADTNTEIFIVKYNSSGNIIWARSAGGIGFDHSFGIAMDNNGYLYITGVTANYGTTIAFGNISLSPNGYDNIYIAKYDTSGNALSVKLAKVKGGGYSSTGICTDLSGNIYITGWFSDSLIFDNTVITSSGLQRDIFIAKYSSSGNVLWAKSAGGLAPDESNSIAADQLGNVYITGMFADSTIVFGNITLTNSAPSPWGQADYFIAKYDSSGNAIWAKSAGNYLDEAGLGVATDHSNNVYVTGYYRGAITFGSYIINNGGYYDTFIVKYDFNGNVLWAKGAGVSNISYSKAITIDSLNNAYITGYYNGSNIVFGNDTLINTNAGSYDLFIAKYDNLGYVKWAKTAGGIYDDYGYGITIDKFGNIYHTGRIYNQAIFDNETITSSFFLAKISGQTLQINKNEQDITLTIFPNPVTNILTINAPQKAIYEIYNLQGQIIKTIKSRNEMTNINVSTLHNGLYILVAQMENGIIVKKFVKE